MKLSEIAEKLDLTVLVKGDGFEKEVLGGYTSDLLSDVMGNIGEGMVWITLQAHRNSIAVASLKEAAAIILIGGAMPYGETLEQAKKEGISILCTNMPAFETSGLIYGLLRNG